MSSVLYLGSNDDYIQDAIDYNNRLAHERRQTNAMKHKEDFYVKSTRYPSKSIWSSIGIEPDDVLSVTTISCKNKPHISAILYLLKNRKDMWQLKGSGFFVDDTFEEAEKAAIKKYNQNVSINKTMKKSIKFLLLIFLFSCGTEENPEPIKNLFLQESTPKVTTQRGIMSAPYTAYLKGIVSGIHQTTNVGFCYSKSNTYPTINDDVIQSKVVVQYDSFEVSIPNLEANSSYYFRAYAQTDNGVIYAEPVRLYTFGNSAGNVICWIKNDL